MGRAATRYIAAVITVGALVIAYALWRDAGTLIGEHRTVFWVIAAGVVLGELRPLMIVRGAERSEVTPSTTFIYALLLIAGTGPAVVVLVVASIISDLVTRKGPVKLAFNASQYAIGLAATGLLLQLLTSLPNATQPPFAPEDLPAIALCAAVFFLCNSLMIAAVIALIGRDSIWRCFIEDFVFQAYTAGLLLGMAPLVVLASEFSLLMLPLLVLPLVSFQQGQHQALVNEHQALHDALTGLPNRVLFAQRVDLAVRIAAHAGTNALVALIDLDRFKEINDTLGHAAGDQVLVQVAKRLQDALPEAGVVARLGGDEFGLLLTGADATPEAVRAVLDAAARTVSLGEFSLVVGASAGIARFPADGPATEGLIQKADIAMYQAKEQGNGLEVYAPERDRYSTRRLQLAGELGRALERGELIPFFQPKLSLATGQVTGVEALMRWMHPRQGLIPPSEFIPIAEQTGLIAEATFKMLDAALEHRTMWAKRGKPLTVAVNLSAHSLLDPTLPTRVRELLHQHGVPPEALELELTESMIMSDPARAETVLGALGAMGIGLAIDDFGTGYSSLAHLRRMPVDQIKIDRSFVTPMGRNRSDAVIVRSTIELARNLGLRTVAEGVEDEAVLSELVELGCDYAQGNLFGAAMSAADLARRLEDPVPSRFTEPAVDKGRQLGVVGFDNA